MGDFDDLSNVTPLRVVPNSGAGKAGKLKKKKKKNGAASRIPADDYERKLADCARQPLNDFGNGQRLIIHYGGDVVFVPRVGWYVWSGKRWEHDADQVLARKLGQRLGASIVSEVPFVDVDGLDAATAQKKTARHRSFANTSGNSARINNALLEASVAVALKADDLDCEPLDLNTQSGLVRFSVVDASEDGGGKVADYEVLSHAREHKQTKITLCEYDDTADCPRFKAFLSQIMPDADMREFLQRWFGLSATAMTRQRLAFFYGSGANGKSVLVDVIARVLGDYAATAKIESLTGSNRRGGGDATPDLVPLMGARFVRTSEPDEGQRLQEGLIKELTGGEPLKVRALREDFVDFLPVFTLTMSGNHKPDIRGTDDGIWRRVLLVPFDVQIPEQERDPQLVSKLVAEAPGILRWICDGVVDFLEQGLNPPQSVIDATEDYRKDSDPLGNFLVSSCVVSGDPGDTITAKELVEAFNFYLMERGEGQWKSTTISRQLKPKSERWRHPVTGARFTAHKASVSSYTGVRLGDTFGKRFRDAPRDAMGRVLTVAPATSE